MIELKYPVILASNSPRRAELLAKLEIPFSIETVDVDEDLPVTISAQEAAMYLADLKGGAHDHLAKNNLIITADTVVISNNKLLGKPKSNACAKAMLESLSNRTHRVITGVCIKVNNEKHLFDVSTKVTFGKLNSHEIEHYLLSGFANDKAGAYGIQDWIGMIGISKMEGSYYNVMGLPTYEVYNRLKNHYSI